MKAERIINFMASVGTLGVLLYTFVGSKTAHAAPSSPSTPTPTPTPPPTSKPSAVTATNPTLRLGSRGDAVRDLQRKLGITADGIFGPETQATVISFQKANWLEPDGIVGPITWSALNNFKMS